MSVFNRFLKFLFRESSQNDDLKKAAQDYKSLARGASENLKAQQAIDRILNKDGDLD